MSFSIVVWIMAIMTVCLVAMIFAILGYVQYLDCTGGFRGLSPHPQPSAYAQRAPQWSPDGEVIVTQSEGVIYAAAVSGDDVWTIPRERPLLERWIRNDPPRYSPTVSSTGLLAYLEKGWCTSLTVKTSDLTGRDLSAIQREVPELRPNVAWSPNGEWLAFGAPEDRYESEERIIVRRHDRKDTRELVLSDHSWGDSSIQAIRWSPDDRLAVVWSGNWNLSVGTVDGAAEFVEGGPGPTLSARVFSPAWSPDGRHLYYALLHIVPSPPDGNLDIIRLDPITLDKRTVLTTWGEEGLRPTLQSSPDGRLLLVSAWGPRDALYVIERNGLSLRNILLSSSEDGAHPFSSTGIGALDASWSPDGSLIAVRNSDPSSEIALYTIRPDGTEPRLLLRRDPDSKMLKHAFGVSITGTVKQ